MDTGELPWHSPERGPISGLGVCSWVWAEGMESSGTKRALTAGPPCKGMKLHRHRVPASSHGEAGWPRAGEDVTYGNSLEVAPEHSWISPQKPEETAWLLSMSPAFSCLWLLLLIHFAGSPLLLLIAGRSWAPSPLSLFSSSLLSSRCHPVLWTCLSSTWGGFPHCHSQLQPLFGAPDSYVQPST